MIEKIKNLGWKQFGGLVLIVIIIIAFGFGGFGGGFSTNNQNNIAKINKTNVTTQDFIDYVNQSGISQETIRENLDNNICLLYTSPSPRDVEESRMPSSA